MSLATIQCVVIIGSALTGAYYGLRVSFGMDDNVLRARYILYCWLSWGVTLGIGGAMSRWRISHSARPHIEGILSNIEFYQTGSHGSGKTTSFEVTTEDGQQIHLIGASYLKKISAGDRAAVTYLEDYHSVLDMKLLSGPNAGWEDHVPDDLRVSAYCEAAGCILAIGSIAYLILKRRASMCID